MNKSDLVIQKVHTKEGFNSLKDRWNTFLAESPANSFFLRWEWLWNWWKVYGEANFTLCILLVYRDAELIGICPFYLTKKAFRVRRLMFLGTKLEGIISEYMDVIAKRDEENAVIEAAFAFIVKEDLCDDISLQKIDASSITVSILKDVSAKKGLYYAVTNRYEVPFINLPASIDEFRDGLSSSIRYKIKREQKKIAKYEYVVFRKTQDIEELDRDFSELVRLHQLRWESRGESGSFAGGKFPVFQKEVMREMLQNGNLELWFLSVAGRNIAALYNIYYNHKIYFFQGGIDTGFDSTLSPGVMIHSYCINEAIKRGLTEYDFLLMGKDDLYKKRWAGCSRTLLDINISHSVVLKNIISAKSTAKTWIGRYLNGLVHNKRS